MEDPRGSSISLPLRPSDCQRASSVSSLVRGIDSWLAASDTTLSTPATAADMPPPSKIARPANPQHKGTQPREEWVLIKPKETTPAAASGNASQPPRDRRPDSPLAVARNLRPEERDHIYRLCDTPRQADVKTSDGHSIKGAVFRSLKPETHISHLAIDEIGQLINERAARSSAGTHVYSALQLDTPPALVHTIRHYITERFSDPLSRDLLLLPTRSVLREWSLVVIDNKSKTITFYSGGAEKGDAEMIKATQLLQHGHQRNGLLWKDGYRRVVKNNTLRGGTVRDSGIITCATMEIVSRGVEPIFLREDISPIRTQLIVDLYNRDLTPLRY